VRWYASNQLLPSGTRQIIVGGRDGPNYEFCPKRYAGEGSFYVPILGGADKLYPYVCLLPNGNVFFFAGRQSVQINWNTQKTVRTYPAIPGPDRNYPSAGSSTVLPLSWTNGYSYVEIMVCEGSGWSVIVSAVTSNDLLKSSRRGYTKRIWFRQIGVNQDGSQ
jgi:hypothetical protein